MSATQAMCEYARLQRRELLVPGNDLQLLESVFSSHADYLLLDCAYTVGHSDKPAARVNIINALKRSAWRANEKKIGVRINGLDSHHMYRDVIEIVEQTGHYLNHITIPNVARPSDVQVVDCLLSQIEYAIEITNPIHLEIMLKNHDALVDVEAIAKSSPRLKLIHVNGVAGIKGRCAIYPSQFLDINNVLSPRQEKSAWAHNILSMVRKNQMAGNGALKSDGHSLDRATVRIAKHITRIQLASATGGLIFKNT